MLSVVGVVKTFVFISSIGGFVVGGFVGDRINIFLLTMEKTRVLEYHSTGLNAVGTMSLNFKHIFKPDQD